MYYSKALYTALAFACLGGASAARDASSSGVGLPSITPSQEPLEALDTLQTVAEENLARRQVLGEQCSAEDARKRRDWAALSQSERKDYIKAVLCLRSLPSRGPPEWSAAQTRYDDFVALHVNLTESVHGSGLFLTWHRAYVWSYETALRDECGYKGARPYWNWFAHTDDVSQSPVFDGSETSMGGDGAFVAHNGSLGGARHIYLPPGKGGGCINSGPFKNARASIGPFAPAMDNIGLVVDTLADYNPRCIKRDLNSYASSKWYTTENLLNVTIGPASETHYKFWAEVQGRYTDHFLGLHTTGHYTINGDNTDLFSSPNDPQFFLHHSMFDRIYWIHQLLHPAEAQKVAGTMTLQNKPPSRNATVDDILNGHDWGDPPHQGHVRHSWWNSSLLCEGGRLYGIRQNAQHVRSMIPSIPLDDIKDPERRLIHTEHLPAVKDVQQNR